MFLRFAQDRLFVDLPHGEAVREAAQMGCDSVVNLGLRPRLVCGGAFGAEGKGNGDGNGAANMGILAARE
jgi:hypothetical protein